MEYFKIQIEGRQFKPAYLIYIIEVSNDSHDPYFYIGQTGDRNHLTARPAFRRLAAHLSDQGKSSENQLYRSIANKILKLEVPTKTSFTSDIKVKTSDYLRLSTITMHVFSLKEFLTASTKEGHDENRNYVEQVEGSIINLLRDRFGEQHVLNKRISKQIALAQEAEDIIAKIIETACP